MQKRSSKIVAAKLIVIAFAAVLSIFILQSFTAKYERVGAFSTGPPPSFTNAPGESNCTDCHTSYAVNSGTGSVAINGLPANYLPNQQIPISVTTAQSDAVVYGFELTAIDSQGKQVGTFALPAQNPAQMQIINGNVGGKPRRYVEHTVSGIVPTTFGSKTWTFNWTAPAQRIGKINFYASGNAANSDGTPSGDYIYTTNRSTLSGTAISNFDGDYKSDIALFRPSNGTWYSLNSSNGQFQGFQFGESGDVPVAADYDGDGKTDFAVWRPSNGVWYVLRSSDGGFQAIQFGQNGDRPVIGDYDGDEKSDVAVFRPSNGAWYILRSSDGKFSAMQFGLGTDKTAQGDYDGDGKTDIAVFRPSEGVWYIQKSRDGFSALQFGTSGDKPIPADYDGDGKTDIAVFRPSNGAWYVQQSTAGFTGVQFGFGTDKPVPADYDGDGKADIAVYRPSQGIWYYLKSSDGSFSATSFGASEDIPVASGYIAP